MTIKKLYPELEEYAGAEDDYDKLGRKINNYIHYVEINWNT
jgi:hypothetical protein